MLNGDALWVAPPDAVEQVVQPERCADLQCLGVVEADSYTGSGFGPGGYGIGYGAERIDWSSTECVRVPGVHGGLVGRLPWDGRFAASKKVGRGTVIAGGEIVRVEEGDIDVPNSLRVEAVPVPMSPDEVP